MVQRAREDTQLLLFPQDQNIPPIELADAFIGTHQRDTVPCFTAPKGSSVCPEKPKNASFLNEPAF